MKTFQEFILECYELEESSSGERSGRRTRGKVTLARGRGADMTRDERSTAAIAKKAGLKGTGKYSTKDLRSKAKDYTTYDSEDDMDDIGSTEQDHYIRSYSSARKAAKGERLISKMKPSGKRTATGMTRLKTAPSKESVRKVKDLRKQMTKSGANKRGSVHTVDIMHRDSGVGKGDRHQQMERGRNFIQAVKDTPKHLKSAGAKKGDTVTGKPTAVMDGEDKKTGEAKRGKLYKKIFGKRSTKPSKKTGLMVGAVSEGKVEWDNPKRPLQSGLTPREKNRAKRISTGVENPNKVSFGGKSYDLSDKDYERYGKLKTAHDDQKDKKVPRNKRHQFKRLRNNEGNLSDTKGQYRRRWKDHKNIRQKLNSKLYKDDERQKVYHQNDLKEPKESFDYNIEEGIQPLPRDKMLRKISRKSQAAHSANVFRKDYEERGLKKLTKKSKKEVEKKASQIKKLKSKLRTHDPVDSRFRELENRDRGERRDNP